MNQFGFDPRDSETLYAATTVGVFRSSDGGRMWDERMAGMKEVHIVVTIALDPERPHILYAGTTGGAYRSTDGAQSWHKINNGLIPAEVLAASLSLGVNTLVIDPMMTDTVYVGTTQGLFKTANRGDACLRIGPSLGDHYISSLLIDPTNSAILYAGGPAGVQKSLDGGQTWQAMNAGLETLNIRTIAMSPLSPQVLWAGTNGSGLYRSTDDAKTWHRVPLVPVPAAAGSPPR